MPNVASGASDVIAALDVSGDLFLAGTVTDSQATLLGSLDPLPEPDPTEFSP